MTSPSGYPPPTAPTSNPERERLRQHFLARDPSAHPAGWNELWEASFAPWDKGRPNPALVDALSQRADLFPSLPTAPSAPPPASGRTPRRRPRALVPGCGRGYDVLLLASHGYDAYGLEASARALEACATLRREQGHEYPALDPEVGCGEVKFLAGDFFSSDWVKEVEGGVGEGFDLIYDYTFLCALPPQLRPSWARRMAELLGPASSGAALVCLEFPTYKNPAEGGPPWAAPPEVYEALLAQPGEEVKYDAEGKVVPREGEGENEKGLEKVAHWKPERTHEIGKGTDWVSVWRHKDK